MLKKSIPKPAKRSVPKRAPSRRAWQRMLSGRRLDLLDPSPLDIEIADIAHGLARVARWNGQTNGAHIFSVAQHTLLVDAIARRQDGAIDGRLALAILLHDAPEFVIGDMITPFKAIIGDAYKAVEQRLQAAIHLRFGLPPVMPAEARRVIKAADAGAAFLEATLLAGFATEEALGFFGPRPALPSNLEREFLTPWPAETAEQRFLAQFRKVMAGGTPGV